MSPVNPQTVTADGIQLRPWRIEDIDDLVQACNDPLIVRWLPLIPHPYDGETARLWVEEGGPAAWEQGGAAFAIADVGTQKVLGGIGLTNVQIGRLTGEIGYWVAPWARGKAVATRAAKAITQWAFSNGLYRLELLAAKENWTSQRVAYAAGFQREGVRREGGPTRDGGRQDLVVFARLAGDPDGPIERVLPDLPGGELSDGVVRLRPLQAADAEDFFALNQLPDVVSSSFGPPVTLEVARQRTATAHNDWLCGDKATCVIEDVTTGAFAGGIGLYYRWQSQQQAMIGYSLRPEFRGKGAATRAVDLISRWAFEKVGIARIIAGTFPENVASQRVLERAGFTREAHMKAALPGRKGERIDDIQYVRINPNIG